MLLASRSLPSQGKRRRRAAAGWRANIGCRAALLRHVAAAAAFALARSYAGCAAAASTPLGARRRMAAKAGDNAEARHLWA